MERVPGFVFCNDKESLTTLVRQALEVNAINPATSDDETSYFLYRDSYAYAQRLEALVNTGLLPNNSAKPPSPLP
jgi:hypothetical protein